MTEPERVVIRDKRRITTEPGEAAVADEPVAEAADPVADELAAQLAERTADLQRLSAEYANYRKRAERERQAAGDHAVGGLLAALLPVIDDIDRARAHGDLTGALKSVADTLQAVLTKAGLAAFGALGDGFDPAVHEAVLHDESADVDGPTVTTIMRQGYRHGERLLRPAMVGVTDPASDAPVVEAVAVADDGGQPPQSDEQ